MESAKHVGEVKRRKRTSSAMIGLSIAQLVVAAGLFILGYFVISLDMAFVAVGAALWGGIAATLAGIFGIVSGLKKNGSLQSTFMILSYLSFFVGIFVLIMGAVGYYQEQGNMGWGCWDSETNEYNEECDRIRGNKRVVDGYIIVIAVVDICVSLINGCYGFKGVCCDGNYGDEGSNDVESEKSISRASKMGKNIKDFVSAVSCCQPQPIQVYLVINQAGTTPQAVPLTTAMPSAQSKQTVVMVPLNIQGGSMTTGQTSNEVTLSESEDDVIDVTEKSLLL